MQKDLLSKFNISMCKVVNTSLCTDAKFSRDDGTAKATE